MRNSISEYLPAQGQGHPAEPTAKPVTTGTLGGWFKASRYPQMPDLIRNSRNAFLLAYLLAYRGRWNSDAFNPYKLQVGEAVCDYHNWGLSEQEFRNGRDKLTAWGFATFRATSRGTIGKLIDTRLFSILASQSNEPANGQATSKQRAEQRLGQRHTKIKELRAENQEQRKIRDSAATQAPPQQVQYSKPSMKELRAYAKTRSAVEGCEGMDDPEAIRGFCAFNEKRGWRLKDWRKAYDGFCREGGFSEVLPPDSQPPQAAKARGT